MFGTLKTVHAGESRSIPADGNRSGHAGQCAYQAPGGAPVAQLGETVDLVAAGRRYVPGKFDAWRDKAQPSAAVGAARNGSTGWRAVLRRRHEQRHGWAETGTFAPRPAVARALSCSGVSDEAQRSAGQDTKATRQVKTVTRAAASGAQRPNPNPAGRRMVARAARGTSAERWPINRSWHPSRFSRAASSESCGSRYVTAGITWRANNSICRRAPAASDE